MAWPSRAGPAGEVGGAPAAPSPQRGRRRRLGFPPSLSALWGPRGRGASAGRPVAAPRPGLSGAERSAALLSAPASGSPCPPSRLLSVCFLQQACLMSLFPGAEVRVALGWGFSLAWLWCPVVWSPPGASPFGSCRGWKVCAAGGVVMAFPRCLVEV